MRPLAYLLVCCALVGCGDRRQASPPANTPANGSSTAAAAATTPAAAPSASPATPGQEAATSTAGSPASRTAEPTQGAAAGQVQVDQQEAWSDRPVTRDHPGGSATLRAVTTSRGPAGTRLVFEFQERVPDYKVAYASAPVQECGSGDDVPLPGTARLIVAFRHAAAHDDDGRVTVAERDRSAVAPDVLRLRLFCDFEGDVSWALALPRKTGFRVTEVSAPPRLVLDLQPQKGTAR